MIQAKCIEKFRDKQGKIYGYKIQDKNGREKNVTSKELKCAIECKQLEVVNLTLTKDGRLIDKKVDTQIESNKFPTDQEIQNIIAKSRMLGLRVDEILTEDNNKCYLIYRTKNELLLLIPSDVTESPRFLFQNSYIQKAEVLGGSGLINTKKMFADCAAQELNLSKFDTSNVINMDEMFYGCKTKKLDLSSFNTHKVVNISRMFFGCRAKTLNISNFDTSKVTDMGGLFKSCWVDDIDLSVFNTSNVTNMAGMFSYCKFKQLDLSNFDTSNVTDMGSMFYNSNIEILDISSFNLSNIIDMRRMFTDCKSKNIIATDQKILEIIQ